MNKNLNQIERSNQIVKQINEIKNDKVHGSTFITKKAINLVYNFVENIKNDFFPKRSLEQILILLTKVQPTMALLINFSNQLLLNLSIIFKKDITIKEKKDLTLSFINHFNTLLELTDKKISQYAYDHLKPVKNLGFYSSSHSVQKTIELFAKNNKNLSIYCSEARPKYEGRKLAETLAKKNIQINLMTDVTFLSKINQIDTLFIGADAITQNGVINKIGSKPLIQLARIYQIDVFCLCSSQKILPSNYRLSSEPKKPITDILNKKQQHIQVINYYFDSTPLHLFTGIITDKGFFSSKEIKKELGEKKLHHLLQS